MFEGMTKKSSFSCFMPFFMSYCPHFWCYRRICMARKTRYMFETYEQKLIVFASYFHFHELCPQIWHTRAIYNDLKTRYMFEGMTKNSSFSCFITIFVSYTPKFCVLGRFTCLRVMTKNLSFLHLWPFSLVIVP